MNPVPPPESAAAPVPTAAPAPGDAAPPPAAPVFGPPPSGAYASPPPWATATQPYGAGAPSGFTDSLAPAAYPSGASASPVLPHAGALLRLLLWVLGGLALVALVTSLLLWQKVLGMQEQLARQSADSGAQSVEARTLAKQALDQARDTAARQAVMDAKLGEVALQRSQLDELMQSLSRSRDENLVVDIDSALRLAQQQAQLTGSTEPLLAALKTAEQRVTRASQPRLANLLRAIQRDADHIRSVSVADTPSLLLKLDELVRLIDELPAANAVVTVENVETPAPTSLTDLPGWWRRTLELVGQETRKLVRVSRIEAPQAMLLSPEHTFFLRENLKLRLLNARLGLLTRQLDVARTDLGASASAVQTYFDPASRKTQLVRQGLEQVQAQLKSAELPRLDATLTALATAAAGR